MNTINRLSRLIAFDTTSRHSNLALIHDCADYLESLGLKPWLSHNADQSKANLFATIAAADGNTEGGLILSGHTDVVPTDGQTWQSDPYRADIREGRLYGRGGEHGGDKAFHVGAAAPAMVQAELKRPLHIALSYDEEIGCLGAPVMIAELQKRGLTPEHCIVGEPTSMRMVVAHKGIHTFRCAVHGKAAHSSLTPQGVNAIEYAAKLIVFINELAGRLKARYDTDPDYDVPFSTLSVNTIAGGIAGNIVPQLCEFEFDYRNLPHMSPADITAPIEAHIREVLQPQMQAVDAACRIDMRHGENVPAMPEAEAALLHDLITQLVEDSSRLKVAYATEGGQFQQAGIATVICGPGNIEQAHKADEFVELSQLARCDAFLHKLIAAQSV